MDRIITSLLSTLERLFQDLPHAERVRLKRRLRYPKPLPTIPEDEWC